VQNLKAAELIVLTDGGSKIRHMELKVNAHSGIKVILDSFVNAIMVIWEKEQQKFSRERIECGIISRRRGLMRNGNANGPIL
jgi:hypothetical protein